MHLLRLFSIEVFTIFLLLVFVELMQETLLTFHPNEMDVYEFIDARIHARKIRLMNFHGCLFILLILLQRLRLLGR